MFYHMWCRGQRQALSELGSTGFSSSLHLPSLRGSCQSYAGESPQLNSPVRPLDPPFSHVVRRTPQSVPQFCSSDKNPKFSFLSWSTNHVWLENLILLEGACQLSVSEGTDSKGSYLFHHWPSSCFWSHRGPPWGLPRGTGITGVVPACKSWLSHAWEMKCFIWLSHVRWSQKTQPEWPDSFNLVQGFSQLHQWIDKSVIHLLMIKWGILCDAKQEGEGCCHCSTNIPKIMMMI